MRTIIAGGKMNKTQFLRWCYQYGYDIGCSMSRCAGVSPTQVELWALSVPLVEFEWVGDGIEIFPNSYRPYDEETIAIITD